ncbi:chaperone protein DnaK [Nitzschia inconspicua]|uniref:Chaperone protein DnaK n=1 Tax=Nitzschia inconspicua TaxID=303405 RepID=A0A9K3KCR0_9STRA|nr:chaperone protein DnaK [Nitzschia inconspicua]
MTHTSFLSTTTLAKTIILSLVLLSCVLPLWAPISSVVAFHVIVQHRHYGASSSRNEKNVVTLALSNSDNVNDVGIGVGIDLGTTNSAIAYLNENNEPQIIEIPNNGRTMPSVVAWNDANDSTSIASKPVNHSSNEFFSKAIVGKEAFTWEQQNQESAYRHVKRILGTSAPFLSVETKQVVPHVVLSANADDNHDKDYHKHKGKQKKLKRTKPPKLERLIQAARDEPTMLYPLGHDKRRQPISPETVSSCILHKLLTVAREHTGRPITRAVIGVPAYFHDEQREATIRAAKACGLDKVKLLREPEAAALAYGVDKQADEQEEMVLVFDLGGGTYDVSVLLVEKGLTEIVCTAGNAQLGGTNFDNKIAKHLQQQCGLSRPSDDAMDIMLRSAERVRIYLSNNKIAHLTLPVTEEGWLNMLDPSNVILSKNAPEVDVPLTVNSTHVFTQLTRRDMERLCATEFQELLRPIREVAIMAGALLPGDARPGAAESAMEMEAAFVNAEKFYADEDSDDQPVVSQDMQAMLQAAVAELNVKSAKKEQQKGRKKSRDVAKQERKFRAESRKVQETQPETVKVRGDGISGRPLSRVILVGGATRMPTIGRIISSLTGVVPQRTVDPDEAVALGCAVHVGVLDGKEELGVVLSPMQAALLRAVVEKERRQELQLIDRLEDDFDDDDEEFTVVEYL